MEEEIPTNKTRLYFETTLKEKIKNLESDKLQKLVDLIIEWGADTCEDLKYAEKELKSCGLLTVIQINKLMESSFLLNVDQGKPLNQASVSEEKFLRYSGEGAENDETFNEEFSENDSSSPHYASKERLFRDELPAIKSTQNCRNNGKNKKPDVKDCFIKLLQELKLETKFPQKLTFTDAITIRSMENLEHNSGLKIIQNILSTDCKAHINKIKIKESRGYFHPMDIMTVIYNCCNQELFSILQTKLFVSKLSIPLIIPDLVNESYFTSIRSLQSIIPELKAESRALSQNLAMINQPIISFLRVSKSKRSKSKLLNQLFCERQPDTFYHRDCDCGNTKRKISNGLVELSCNLPSNNKNCNFKEFFTVLNLRGNALEFKNQVQWLIEVSSLIVLFLNERDVRNSECETLIRELKDRGIKFLIALVFDQIHEINSLNKISGFIDLSITMKNWDEDDELLNDKDWHKLVVTKINNMFHELDRKPLSDINKVIHVASNVPDKFPTKLFSQVDAIIEKINFVETKLRRPVLLPLQSQCWSEIAKITRYEKTHKNIENIEMFVAGCHNKRKQLRDDQLKLYISNHCFIKDIIQMVNIGNFKTVFNLIKEKLDLITVCTLNNFKDDLSKQIDTNGSHGCKLPEFNEIMSQASFGLEHIMREIAQVYEAHFFRRIHTNTSISNLPVIAAKMLVNGFPIEIMDGDNMFVPTDWVKAVFSELETILGSKKKVLVVSVLGIQSSGKSTMLNTMFGLQLAVSHGRCTKGVFCSLISVEKTESKFDYDYVMVVDTEGLRATELADQKRNRDNELATFAIGLGDVAIMNIKGENFSEIQDTLEIVIHAFIKIKKANSFKAKPKCMFVHQNVTGLNVEEDLKLHQKHLINKLDRITQVAAHREKAVGINRFSDIIEMDDGGIFYVPDLWQGYRPMAFVNDAYIDKITEIKNFLLQTSGKFARLKDLKNRIKDLWNALICEDFVFSFRNSEEYIAFDKLDKKMSDIMWRTKIKLIELKEKLSCELHNCESQQLFKKIEEQREKINVKVNDFEQLFLAEVKEFLNNHEQKHILINWENQTKRSVTFFIENEKSNIIMALNKERKVVENKISNENIISQYKAEFLIKAQQTAIELQNDSVSDHKIENRFNEIWKEFLEKLSTTSSDPAEDNNFLKNTFQKFLEPLFPNTAKFYEKLYHSPLNTPFNHAQEMVVRKNDITVRRGTNPEAKIYKIKSSFTSVYNKITGSPDDKKLFTEEADKMCQEIKRKILSSIDALDGKHINETHIKSIVFDELETLFACEGNLYDFTAEFQERFSLAVSRLAYEKFVILKDIFREQNDIKLQIEKQKNIYFGLFKDTYENKTSDVIAANQTYNVVLGWIEDSILSNMTSLISFNVKERHECFQTKKTFLKEVLLRLMERDSFELYTDFLRNQKSCLIYFFNGIISELLNSSDEEYSTLFESIVTKKIILQKSKFEAALNEACKCSNHLSTIYEHLKNSLHDELNLTENCEVFEDLKISDSKSFKDLFSKHFENIVSDCWSRISDKKLTNKFRVQGVFDLKTSGDLLAENLIGCKARCPFCGNICDLTVNNHAGDHRCSLHLLQGINGVHCSITDKLFAENCSQDVDSSINFRYPLIEGKADGKTYYPYKDYKTFYPDWDIPPDSSLNSSLYWKRFMAKFNDDLAKFYGLKPGDVPIEWHTISAEEANESL